MENIIKIKKEIDVLNDELSKSIVKYIEENGEVSTDGDNLGQTEDIDVYDKDGVSHECSIRTVCVSDGQLYATVAHVHQGEEDSDELVSNGMLGAVFAFLEYNVKPK